MSTFWIDDLEQLADLLPEINKRMGIRSDGNYYIEESATLKLYVGRKDSDCSVIVIRAEKSKGQSGKDWVQRLELEWNMDFQSIDEIIYDLKKLLGL